MELEDIIQLIIGFMFFVLPTLGRLINGLRRRGQSRDRAADSEANADFEDYEEEDEGSDYDYVLEEDLEDEDVPELVAHDSHRDASPAEAGADRAELDPRDRARELMRRQLGDVFRSLGLEVSFGGEGQRSKKGGASEAAPQEWTPEESVWEDVPEEELFDPNREQGDWDLHGERNSARESYARGLRELEAKEAATLEQAERLRAGRHSNLRSAQSLEILRDAIVLNTMLARPRFGSLPRDRGPR